MFPFNRKHKTEETPANSAFVHISCSNGDGSYIELRKRITFTEATKLLTQLMQVTTTTNGSRKISVVIPKNRTKPAVKNTKDDPNTLYKDTP